MKKPFLLTGALALGLTLNVFAQNPTQIKYANTITAGDLREYLTYLASDEMRGRDTGSEEQKIAAKYLADLDFPVDLPASLFLILQRYKDLR